MEIREGRMLLSNGGKEETSSIPPKCGKNRSVQE
jgi:hypothetical protein